jgi:hypothetical protein
MLFYHPNKKQALQRAHQLESSLRRNPEKLKHFLAFMEKVINNGAAEKSSKIEDDKERWYLPIFNVLLVVHEHLTSSDTDQIMLFYHPRASSFSMN